MKIIFQFIVLTLCTTPVCCLNQRALDRENVTAEAKVLILGAGMTGVSAVATLKEAGIEDFIILEGSDRIGGRVKEAGIGGYTVQLGASWIQGTYNASKPYNNPVLDLALKYNLTYTDAFYDDWIVRNGSGADLTDLANYRYEDFYAAFVEARNLSRQMQTTAPDVFKDDLSLEAAFRKYGWTPETPVDRVIEVFDIDTEHAEQADVCSTRFSSGWSYYDFQDEDFLVTEQGDRGYSKILVAWMADLISENDSRQRLFLNKYVTDIAYDEDGVVVTTSNGERYSAEYVIVTFSIGVLQSDVVTFEPPLPEWKTDSIDAFTMSLYTHFYLKFPDNSSAFWDDVQYIMYAGNTGGYFSTWQNLDKRTLPGSRILQCTVVGDVAEDLDYLTDSEIQDKAMEVLRDMYGDNVTEPEEILVPRWKTDPFTFGSYSHWPTGYTIKQHDALRAPVGRVHLAGEAMSLRLARFLQGAYFSGQETAQAVAKCLSENSCQDSFVPHYEARGCTYREAKNYREGFKEDDGSCRFNIVSSFAVSIQYTYMVVFLALLNSFHLIN